MGPRRLLVVFAWVALGAVLVAVPAIPPICPLRLVFHVPCPSCGLTRAARAVVHGDFAGATRLHPLWWLVFPFVGAVGALEGADYLRTGRTGRWTAARPVQVAGGLLVALLVVVWCARWFGAFGGPVAVE